MDVPSLLQIGQLGTSGILVVILFKLWDAFDKQNEFIREQLEQSQAERKVIADHLGITTQQLGAAAQVVRRQMDIENPQAGAMSDGRSH